MGSLGSIGTVNAQFTASTSNFSASLKEVGASLQATGEKAAAAGEKTAAGVRVMTTAAERARQAWQRELTAQAAAAEASERVARANELAALKADILSRGNEILARSADVTATAFERMAASVKQSVGAMGEQITAVAEKAELSADGIAAGFGGLGKLLGAGLLGDFVAHTLDNLAELNVTLGDLHEKTGMAVQDLAGLRLAAMSKGLDFNTISMGMIRLARAMYEAKQGMQEDREAFSTLGISMKEINSLSLEDMFYRISKAVGENRSLVVSDATALELFGRGGKEVVPMLREWGAGLETVAKEQGALSGITDESVRASQQWLQATTDLSAEFHSALIPALIDLVKLLPYVETGFDLLEAGVEQVFGTIINAAATVVESVGDIGKAIKDLATGHPSDALQDIKSIWTADQKGWQLQAANIQKASLAAATAWNNRGGPDLTHGFEGAGQNGMGQVDGALLKQAKQTLATMEEKKPLSHEELIKYWQGILAEAQKGSSDYEQVNLVLGGLMEHPGNPDAGQSKIVQQWRRELDDEKAARPETTPLQETQFWLQRAEFAKPGSLSGADAMDQADKIIARMHAANATAGREFEAEGGGPVEPTDTAAQAETRVKANDYLQKGADLSAYPEVVATLKEQGRAWSEALKSMNAYAAAGKQQGNEIAEAGLKLAVATGQISKLDAAQVQAQMHTQEFTAAWTKLQEAMAFTAALPEGPEKQRELYQLGTQAEQMQGQRSIQVLEDQQAISDQTFGGASREALDRMVADWEDMATKVASTLVQTIGSFNDDIAKLVMGEGGHSRQQIGTMFGKTFRAGGEGLIRTGLQGAEAGVLGKFGLGGGKKPTGTQGDPLYTVVTNLGGGGGGGGGNPVSAVAGALTSRIPGAAPAAAIANSIFGGGGNGRLTIPAGASSSAADAGRIIGQGGTLASSLALPQFPSLPPLTLRNVSGPSADDNAVASSGIANLPMFPSLPAAALPNVTGPALGIMPSGSDGTDGAGTNGVGNANKAYTMITPGKPSLLDSILGDTIQQAGKIGGSLLTSGFAGGGQVFGPGSGTSDSIPAMLSHGEFVTNARSTAKHLPLLHQINNDALHFADGGMVGSDILDNYPSLVGDTHLGSRASAAPQIMPSPSSVGGDTYHSYTIDARGATDPAQTQAAVQRAMRQYGPQMVSASLAAAKNQRLRTPATAR